MQPTTLAGAEHKCTGIAASRNSQCIAGAEHACLRLMQEVECAILASRVGGLSIRQ